eukprot:2881658-Prymnesium_polylepis.1
MRSRRAQYLKNNTIRTDGPAPGILALFLLLLLLSSTVGRPSVPNLSHETLRRGDLRRSSQSSAERAGPLRCAEPALHG